jgi:hypothetical protein
MAVTIDEMRVEVQSAPPPAPSEGSSPEPRKDVDLHQALELLHERKLRLKAD